MDTVLTTIKVTFPVVLAFLVLGIAFVLVLREWLHTRKQLREAIRRKPADRWNETVVFAHHLGDASEIVRLQHELKQVHRLNRRWQETAFRWNAEYHAAIADFAQRCIQLSIQLEAANRQAERWHLAFHAADSERATAQMNAVRWHGEFHAVVDSPDAQCAHSA